MKIIALIAAAALLATAAPAAAEVADCSRTEPSGERTLCHEIVVPAPIGDVWALWTTSAGLNSWVAPVAAIEPQPGGMFESSYDPGARIGDPGNIRNRVVAISPPRLLAIQVARAPPNFPHASEVRQLATLIELAPEGPHATRVRVSMLGYGSGEAFDALYGHFSRGNAWTLNRLYERVTRGPVDWRAALQAQGQ